MRKVKCSNIYSANTTRVRTQDHLTNEKLILDSIERSTVEIDLYFGQSCETTTKKLIIRSRGTS